MINLFYIGQKIVALDCWGKVAEYDEWGNRLPRARVVYTIRNFNECTRGKVWCNCHLLGLRVEEIVNTPKQACPDGDLGELSFNAEYFRPVQETDVWKAKRVKELV